MTRPALGPGRPKAKGRKFVPQLHRALREERCVVVTTEDRVYGPNGTLWVGKVTATTVSLRDKLRMVVTLRLSGLEQVVLFPADPHKIKAQRAGRR